jgi:hypothetical protein
MLKTFNTARQRLQVDALSRPTQLVSQLEMRSFVAMQSAVTCAAGPRNEFPRASATETTFPEPLSGIQSVPPEA